MNNLPRPPERVPPTAPTQPDELTSIASAGQHQGPLLSVLGGLNAEDAAELAELRVVVATQASKLGRQVRELERARAATERWAGEAAAAKAKAERLATEAAEAREAEKRMQLQLAAALELHHRMQEQIEAREVRESQACLSRTNALLAGQGVAALVLDGSGSGVAARLRSTGSAEAATKDL